MASKVIEATWPVAVMVGADASERATFPLEAILRCSRQVRPIRCANVEKAFAQIDLPINMGGGVKERGLDAKSGRVLVQVDPRYFRPTEVDLLVGDPSKARLKLGWQHKVSFEQLVAEMVAADLKTIAGERSRVLTAAD